MNIFEKVLPLEVSMELNGIETKKMMFTENISVKWTLDLSRKRSKAFDEIHIRCSKAAKPGAGDDRKISIRMDKVKYTPWLWTEDITNILVVNEGTKYKDDGNK